MLVLAMPYKEEENKDNGGTRTLFLPFRRVSLSDSLMV